MKPPSDAVLRKAVSMFAQAEAGWLEFERSKIDSETYRRLLPRQDRLWNRRSAALKKLVALGNRLLSGKAVK